MGKYSSTTWKSCGVSAFTVIIEISALVSISNFIVSDGVFDYLRLHVSLALYNLKVYSPPVVTIIVSDYVLSVSIECIVAELVISEIVISSENIRVPRGVGIVISIGHV
uniref:Uncharacterized protein n=1 Tax=Glossina pallidipes TaxID=7398 RepID=A0A1A9ZM34_GLOPL